MAQTAAGRYTADFKIQKYGSYLLKAVHKRNGKTVAESLGSVALSYPLEYLRTTPDPEPLKHAAQVSGGHDQAKPAQIWDAARREGAVHQDLWPYVLLARRRPVHPRPLRQARPPVRLPHDSLPVSIKQLRILAIVATDRTFEPHMLDGSRVWVGKCIHCGRKLTIGDDGTPSSNATIEHIWPRTHGGENDIENLALACAGCNREKGVRHDRRHKGDERLGEIVDELRRRRIERWRDPEEVGLASRLVRVLRRPLP